MFKVGIRLSIFQAGYFLEQVCQALCRGHILLVQIHNVVFIYLFPFHGTLCTCMYSNVGEGDVGLSRGWLMSWS